MNCDNFACSARREPDIPCWELARRVEAYHDISNTCSDCLVYILNEESSVLGMDMRQYIILQREHMNNPGAGHQGCIEIPYQLLVEKYLSHSL